MPGGSGLEDGRRRREKRDREKMDRKGEAVEVAGAGGSGSAAAVSLSDRGFGIVIGCGEREEGPITAWGLVGGVDSPDISLVIGDPYRGRTEGLLRLPR